MGARKLKSVVTKPIFWVLLAFLSSVVVLVYILLYSEVKSEKFDSKNGNLCINDVFKIQKIMNILYMKFNMKDLNLNALFTLLIV